MSIMEFEIINCIKQIKYHNKEENPTGMSCLYSVILVSVLTINQLTQRICNTKLLQVWYNIGYLCPLCPLCS